MRNPIPAAPAWLALALLVPGALPAADVPVASDTYVSSVNLANNYGALPSLYVGNNNKALLRFDLSALPSGATSTNIVKANLVFYVNRIGIAGALDVAPLTGAWSESTVTGAAAPPQGAVFASLAATQSFAYIVVDITPLVKGWVDTPSSNFGLAIQAAAAAPGTVALLDSKESSTTSHPAFLDISYASAGPPGPGGAQGTVGAIGEPGPTGAPGPASAVKGPTGPTGPTGPAGANGPTGVAGANGPPGGQGLPGPQGPAGPAGSAGSQGIQGTTGPPGSTGPQGNPGSAGAKGATGGQGSTGATGLAGLTGAQGSTGPQGPPGSQGPQGPNGAQGPAGPTGTPGNIALVSQVAAGGTIPDSNTTSLYFLVDNSAGADNQSVKLPIGSVRGQYLQITPKVPTAAGKLFAVATQSTQQIYLASGTAGFLPITSISNLKTTVAFVFDGAGNWLQIGGF